MDSISTAYTPNASHAQVLLGDASDIVKGVDGIGKKTA